MIRGNIFSLQESVQDSEKELFEILFTGNDVKVERIISSGQITPEGQWYDQAQDEWVVLLQGYARLQFDDGEEVQLERGDFILIPIHRRHRVTYTSIVPVCIWLAIHGNIET